jgi:hypothetical protein
MNYSLRPRCDTCGRFMTPGAPGTSWVMVPDCPPMGFGDERERCAPCTERDGPAECSPTYRRDLCCGVVPPASAATRTPGVA